MKYYIYAFVFFVLSLSSCDEAVDLEGFKGNSKELVLIYSSISPQDEILKVQVSKTLSSVNTIAENDLEAFVISNAIVTLSNTTGEIVQLLYVTDELNYQIEATQLKIIPGATYNLSVTVDGEIFSSFCTIPINTVSQIDHNQLDNLDEDGNLKASVTISFQDISGESNRYIVGARLENRITGTPLYYGSQRFVTDQIQDGAFLSSFGFFPLGITPLGSGIALQVANVEPILYDNLFAAYSNQENKDSPFYEIIIPPNNITGANGYGVFAGFQIKVKEITYQ